MKLKSISIHGFKSFADRITLSYNDGITGVIGPNGSGKSNIIDAVRWVMGEQTAKHLRADDPKDIIFAGSQNRKPLSMAEVTLTFTNTGTGCPPEFLHLPEISIGRRIYRSGEREYFMNKQPCRLKDIVDFLMAAGLGAKSYSIIEQERRDRIIQANPEDLREILSETAGISIFKQRRKESEKRLESTEESLKRLGDIESELLKQSESLKEQVEKAARKMQLVTELREKETNLIANHVGFYRGLAARIRSEIEARAQEEEKSVIESAQWETNANELKTEQIELSLRLKDVENRYDDRKLALTKLTERIENHRRRSEEKVEHKAKLAKMLAEERSVLQGEEEREKSFLKDLEQTEKEMRRIEGELEHLNFQIEEIDESMQVERIRGEELRSEIRAIDDNLTRLRARNESILQAVQKANTGLLRTLEQIQSAAASKGQIAADRQHLENQLRAISQGLQSVAMDKSRCEGELQELETEMNRTRAARDETKERYLELSGAVGNLQKLVAANQGLSDGAKALRDRLNEKISGFVFDAITVHKDDESILERALPELLESAIVEDSEVLVDILDKAEEEGLTRVGFIVKDILHAPTPEELAARKGILSIPGLRCVGDRALRIANPELRYLIDRIFIARDEWLMLKAHRSYNADERFPFVFVTERGTVLACGREVQFGELKGGEGLGLLQRKRELAELVAEQERLQGILAQAEGALFATTEKKKAIENRLSQIQFQLSKEQAEVVKLTAGLEGFDLQLKHSNETLARLDEEKAALEAEIKAAKEDFTQNQTRMDSDEADKQRIARDLSDFDSDFQDKKERRDTIHTQLQNKRAERAVTVERQANYRTNYEELRLHLQRSQNKVDRAIQELSEIESQIARFTDDTGALEREIATLRYEVANLESELSEVVAQEAEASEKLRVFENKLKSQKDNQALRKKFIEDKKVELGRYVAIVQTAEKDALDKFNLRPEDLPQDAEDDPATRSKLESRVRKLQSEITELGSVNELAVEEFRAVEERRTFLVSQKEDILRSIEELRLAIAEIEETTKSRFKETYDVVNREFQSLFPILFPGGFAELVLQNPEDLLNTGVEILVKLPGKRQQNMKLFSGGEKALTAISLIFALLRTKPAPFCYLDEVDAPLDEANVGRYNEILEALSDQFQFVVITHNRRTMEILDTIYGISMTEPGVSRLVAVDMSDVPTHLQKKKKPEAVAPSTAAPAPVLVERPGATTN